MPAYVYVLDLTKAFDKVRLRDFLNIIEKHNIHTHIIEVIRYDS